MLLFIYCCLKVVLNTINQTYYCLLSSVVFWIVFLIIKSYHCRGGSRISSQGAHLKNSRRAEGGANIFGVFRVKNQGGEGRLVRPLLDPPLHCLVLWIVILYYYCVISDLLKFKFCLHSRFYLFSTTCIAMMYVIHGVAQSYKLCFQYILIVILFSFFSPYKDILSITNK